MKLIICGHPEMDFLGASITIGCYEGGHDIYELPYIRHLHGGVDKDYLLADGSRGYTGTPGFIADNPLPPNEKTEEEVLEAVKDADLIVCHSTRRFALEALDKIVARLGKVPENLIIADGEDHSYIDRKLISRYSLPVFFKRELYNNHSLDSYRKVFGIDIIPLQFGAPIRSMPKVDDSDKKWDFVLTLGNTHEMRLHLLGACLKADIPNSYIGGDSNNPLRAKYSQMKDLLGWREYMTMIAQAKVTANCRGFGRDTLNFFERMCWNTMMFYCPPELHIPYPFEDEKHCVHIDEGDFDGIGRLTKTVLKWDTKRERIAKAGRDHCHKHHSMKARVEYMIDIAMKVIGGEKLRLEKYGL